jgi:hypothetical protein
VLIFSGLQARAGGVISSLLKGESSSDSSSRGEQQSTEERAAVRRGERSSESIVCTLMTLGGETTIAARGRRERGMSVSGVSQLFKAHKN